MELHILKPRKALNKAFLKVKPNRTEIESFKTNLAQLLDSTNDTESEEFHKNLVIDFLKKTYYDPNHFVNTKGRNDLVIHNGNKAASTVGVIIEAKKPTNKSEMLTKDKINTKAFQELVLYYLRERITLNNIEIKYLIVTNIYEWFIFDATIFDRFFAQNKNLVKQFNDFEGGRLADTKTDFFYKQIAEPFISEINQNIDFTYFDIREYEKPLRNDDKKDDNKLIALFKLLSPEHLLKLPFVNDSNSLDKRFYGELLHLIGLTETKQGSKKIIERNKDGERNTGTFLENAIIQLDSLDKISRLKNPNQFGANQQERLFNVGLELSITWINRILFLKLLEAQLVTYHKGDKSFEFLSIDKIKDYDDLNTLFFQVLARKQEERNEDVKTAFSKVPYLNSSLFEPTEIEHSTLFISQLGNDKAIPIYSQTVLKDDKGKKRTGEINPLEYLFAFLNAYDFSSEGSEEIQEDNKTLINASVLGLIFEKINGYKDGSFFTPGFITMYMCRETIRKAVIQKFNEAAALLRGNTPLNPLSKDNTPLNPLSRGEFALSDNSVVKQVFRTLDDVYEQIGEDRMFSRQQANEIINSLKICDPAVGSGHFLVSALNEMIAVKNDLKILQDRDGRRLKEYQVEVVNDELIVTDEEGELFEYTPLNPLSRGDLKSESQRIQETLFHEKQTIIENCLFGVDINPNSVKICRLRLWIELLKNAYYIKSSPPLKGGVPEGGGGLKNIPEGGGGFQLNNLPYLKTFRKELRNNITPAEAKLWTMLKGKQMEGRKFRRQHSFANYILDFYCPEERLAIELDGQGHFEATQAEYDRERDLFLEVFGIRVLRFENKWVWDNPDGLLEEIKNYFGKQPNKSSSPDKGRWSQTGGVSDSKQPPRPQPPRPLGTPPEEGNFPPSPADTPSQPPRPADTPPYKGGERKGLETLPNIDINIKCGNSLVSRFALDTDLKQALKKSKWTIDSYRIAVATYRNAESKEQKREMERLIADIKSDFRSEISENDPKVKKRRKLLEDLYQLTQQPNLFEMNKKEKADWNKKVAKLTQDTKKLEAEIEDIKNNVIYDNAFEWRFEFPEVLNDDGDFVGFDVVIGNPPYISNWDLSECNRNIVIYLEEAFKPFLKGHWDLFGCFVMLGSSILKDEGYNSYILPTSFYKEKHSTELRRYFLNQIKIIELIDFKELVVFEDVARQTGIYLIQKTKPKNNAFVVKNYIDERGSLVKQDFFKSLKNFAFKTNVNNQDIVLFEKLNANSVLLGNIVCINTGVVAHSKVGSPIKFTKDDVITKQPKEGFKEYVIGSNLSSHTIVFDGTYLDYDLKKDFFHRPKYPLLFESNKIIVRRISGKNNSIIACFDDSKYYSNDNLMHLVKWNQQIMEFQKPEKKWNAINDSNFSLKLITAILNSKLSTYFFSKFLSTDTLQGSYSSIYPEDLRQIPIKQDENLGTLIENYVGKVIEQKKQNPSADTTDLENQIDQMVYQLYDLTEEEIKIIERE